MNFNKTLSLAFYSVLLLNFFIGSVGETHEDPKDIPPPSRFTVFNSCYYCHSLKPDVHLTGPSLANIWGKKAGKVKGFELYSDSLKNSDFTWNEKTIEDWIRDPHKLAEGTTMPDPRIDDEKLIKASVDFLKIAMAEGGFDKAVKQKLISKKIGMGQLPKYISEPDKTLGVKEIESCGQVYSLVLSDGSKKKIWKFNLSFKILAGDLGPKENQPVLTTTGSMGDRFEINFHSFKEISAMLTECKAKP